MKRKAATGDEYDMQCKDVTNDLLADRLDGILDPASDEAIAGHLERCAGCRKRAEEVEKILSGVEGSDREFPVPERTDRAVADLIGRLARERKAVPAPPASDRSPWFPRIWVSAAAVVFAVAGFLAGAMVGFPGLSPRPPATGTAGATGSPEILRQKLERAERERAGLSETLTSIKSELDAIRKERRRLESGLEEANASLARAAADSQALRGQVGDLQAEIKAERKRAATLATERTGLLERVSALEAELDGSSKRVTECLSRIGRLEGANRTLSVAVGTARSEVAELQEKNRDLETRLKVPGDLNRDGTADVLDAREICLRLAGGGEVPFVPEADLNSDGKIDVADALLIAKFSTGSH